jgi:hypothetical protein
MYGALTVTTCVWAKLTAALVSPNVATNREQIAAGLGSNTSPPISVVPPTTRGASPIRVSRWLVPNPEEAFLEEIRSAYAGKVVVGHDLDIY